MKTEIVNGKKIITFNSKEMEWHSLGYDLACAAVRLEKLLRVEFMEQDINDPSWLYAFTDGWNEAAISFC